MANTSVCNDTSEAVELYEPQGLYLKPVAKINICAQLPQLKTPGKTISNWEVMEKVKHMIRPETFLSVKVVKSTMEFIRLEGEIENKSKLALLTMKLDGKTIKLSGFPESLKVRAAETKVAFPVRHDWDSYFRDAKNMNELRPGERPDTIHLKDLPTRWFAERSDKEGQGQGKGSKLRPSEDVLRQVFGTFGEVRYVDIPMLDPYRKEIMGLLTKPGTIQTFNYGQDIQFEAYVQYQEYISFVKAMDALRGMKLMFKEDEDKAYTACIKVDFDKNKHMSDKLIRKRHLERERLKALEQLRQAQLQQAKEEEERRKEEERQIQLEMEKEKQKKKEEKQRLKEERRKEREEKRRQKRIDKKQRKEEERMRKKVALEERKLLIAQRKLESLRLLSELFEKVKAGKLMEALKAREAELEEQRKQEVLAEQRRRLEEERIKAEAQIQKKLQLRQQELALREKLLKNFKAKEEREQEEQRESLRQKLAGSRRLKSAVIMKKSPSSTVDDGPNDQDASEDRLPPDKDQKEKTKEGSHDDDDDDVKVIEKEEKEDKDITVIEVSSEDEEEPSPKMKKPTSVIERVLQANRFRAGNIKCRKQEDRQRRPKSTSQPVKQPRRKKIVIVKRVSDSERKKESESDSDDSTTIVIPPPRSSFAPHDDPINFIPPPGLMFPPWGPYFPPGSIPPPWQSLPPPSPTPPFRFGSGRRNSRPVRGRAREHGFHSFKEPYLKKYNVSHHGHSRSVDSSSVSRSGTQRSRQRQSKERDSDGRYMFPLS